MSPRDDATRGDRLSSPLRVTAARTLRCLLAPVRPCVKCCRCRRGGVVDISRPAVAAVPALVSFPLPALIARVVSAALDNAAALRQPWQRGAVRASLFYLDRPSAIACPHPSND